MIAPLGGSFFGSATFAQATFASDSFVLGPFSQTGQPDQMWTSRRRDDPTLRTWIGSPPQGLLLGSGKLMGQIWM